MRISDVYLLTVCNPLAGRECIVLAVFSDRSEVEQMADYVRESHTFEGDWLEFDDDSDVGVMVRTFFDHTR